jgi:hypothetical protein
MQHLLRRQFLNQVWGAEELDRVCEFWRRLYERSCAAAGASPSAALSVELRLRGFPRHKLDEVRAELQRRLARVARVAGPGFPAVFQPPEILVSDPDTLSISFAGALPPAGLGLPQLAGGPFEGLMVEARLAAGPRPGEFVRCGEIAATLVVVGELADGRLLVKSTWRAGIYGWEDELCWSGGWPQEEEFHAGLAEYRKSNDVPLELAHALFVPRYADWGGNFSVRMISVPLDKPRFLGLLLRASVFALFFLGLVLAVQQMIVRGWWLGLLPIVVVAWVGFWLLWHFVTGEFRLLFRGYEEFRSRYAQLYEQSVVLVPLTREESEVRMANPWARKYTTELEAAGFVQLGDLQIKPAINGDGVVRIFCGPDGVTYLNLLFMMSTHPDPALGFLAWPATVSFLGTTYFTDGGRATSVNGRTNGYRKKRTGPEHLARVFADAEDPLEFVRLHAEAAGQFAKQTGRSPQRHEPLAQYVRRQNEMQEEERRLFVQRPYTWGDHWRWYLQAPRWEYS